MSQEHRSHKHTTPHIHPLLEKVTPARNTKKGTRGTLRILSKRSSLGSADVFNGFKLYVERANCFVGDRL